MLLVSYSFCFFSMLQYISQPSLLRTISNPLYLSTAVDSSDMAAVTWLEGVGVRAVDYMSNQHPSATA
jgi:hypothetical protein